MSGLQQVVTCAGEGPLWQRSQLINAISSFEVLFDDLPFLMKPRRFMLNFPIFLLAYPNGRTEPQSDIGPTEGKNQY